MDDAVARYCTASEAKDMQVLTSTFAPYVELPSPLFASLRFQGSDDVKMVLRAVYALRGEVEWGEQIGTGSSRACIAHTKFFGVRIDDTMIFELDAEGRIRYIRPHLRPLFVTIVFTLLLGPRVARHPSVALRALRNRSSSDRTADRL